MLAKRKFWLQWIYLCSWKYTGFFLRIQNWSKVQVHHWCWSSSGGTSGGTIAGEIETYPVLQNLGSEWKKTVICGGSAFCTKCARKLFRHLQCLHQSRVCATPRKISFEIFYPLKPSGAFSHLTRSAEEHFIAVKDYRLFGLNVLFFLITPVLSKLAPFLLFPEEGV